MVPTNQAASSVVLVFARTVRQLRAESRQSRKHVAEKTGIAYSTLGSYERAEVEPTLTKAVVLADHFSVDICRLVRCDRRH
jgi:DNA-binding XRE family transcriptional regulator